MRMRRKRDWIITACSAFLLAGAAAWWAARPQYATFTTHNIGAEPTALRIVYPAGWTIESMPTPSSTTQVVMLHSPARSGLQAWIDSHVFSIPPDNQPYCSIHIMLRSDPGVRDLDAEARNMKSRLLPTTIRGDVHRSRNALGTVLSCDFTNSGRVQKIDIRTTYVYPEAKPDAPQYVVYVICTAVGGSKDRAFRAGDEIVARLKLVQGAIDGRADRIK